MLEVQVCASVAARVLARGSSLGSDSPCLGSALAVPSELGEFWTSAHVVEGRSDLVVERDGVLWQVERVRIVGLHAQLATSDEAPRPRLNVRSARCGEEVVVAGFPAHGGAIPRLVRSWVMAIVPSDDEGGFELQGAFPLGFSGAGVFAVSDGAVLGLLEGVGLSILGSRGEFAFGVAFGLERVRTTTDRRTT